MRIKVSVGEIGKAVKAVDRYRKDLKAKVALLVTKLAQAGVKIASAKVYDMGAIGTGDLDSSIHYLVSDDGKGAIVRTDCAHAVYVEFGTGIKGQRNPHPVGLPGWVYDINEHGESGWWYPSTAADPNPYKHVGEDGSWWAWTRGMPSRPFMYQTAMELRDFAASVAREVFKT